jgi:hypothetical protein
MSTTIFHGVEEDSINRFTVKYAGTLSGDDAEECKANCREEISRMIAQCMESERVCPESFSGFNSEKRIGDSEFKLQVNLIRVKGDVSRDSFSLKGVAECFDLRYAHRKESNERLKSLMNGYPGLLLLDPHPGGKRKKYYINKTIALNIAPKKGLSIHSINTIKS